MQQPAQFRPFMRPQLQLGIQGSKVMNDSPKRFVTYLRWIAHPTRSFFRDDREAILRRLSRQGVGAAGTCSPDCPSRSSSR